MKSTDNFKKVISDELQQRGKKDPLFAVKLKNIKKNIDDCVTYILNTVKKSGCCGFSDDEVFGMAAHYYDEENIEVGKPVDCNVVVNHSLPKPQPTEPTAKPSTQMKSNLMVGNSLTGKPSINKTVLAQVNKPKEQPKPEQPKPQPTETGQLSLF